MYNNFFNVAIEGAAEGQGGWGRGKGRGWLFLTSKLTFY